MGMQVNDKTDIIFIIVDELALMTSALSFTNVVFDSHFP